MDDIYRKVPLMLSAILYDYNYIDGKIIAALKNKSFILRKENNKLLVPAIELNNILRSNFAAEIDKTGSFPQDRLSHGMNTAFQLFHLLNYYTNLKAVTINISKDRNYSKIVDTQEGVRLVGLDYKIDKCLLRYDEYLTSNQLIRIVDFLRELEIVNTIRPYSSYNIYASDYLYSINELAPKLKTEYKDIISFTKSVLNEKIELDNPLLTIIIDNLK